MAIKLMEKYLKALWGYSMLLYSVTVITFIIFLCIPSIVLAKFLYITPTAEVALRAGKGNEYRVVAVIQNGSQVELLEEDGAWAMVRTSNKKKGWMPKRYLSSSLPLKDVVASLQVQRNQLKKQLAEIRKQLDEAIETRNRIGQHLNACILDRDRSGKENILKVDPKEFSCTIDVSPDSFLGIVVKEDSVIYLKPYEGKIKEFSCKNKKIELKSEEIKDGFVSTKKFGKIKIGLTGPPEFKQEVHLWLTSQQKKSLQEAL